MRELTSEDATAAVRGGGVLACGGGVVDRGPLGSAITPCPTSTNTWLLRTQADAIPHSSWCLPESCQYLHREERALVEAKMREAGLETRIDPAHLERRDPDTGQRLGAAMSNFGLDPGRAIAQSWAAGSLHGYVELRVEQGPQLERSGSKVGVVTAIAGIERLLASFSGRADLLVALTAETSLLAQHGTTRHNTAHREKDV